MAIVEEQEMSETVNAKGALVVVRPGGASAPEVYEITKIPLASMSLVQHARDDILLSLNLRGMITDLNRTSDLMYLAYLGVIGSGVLQANISKRQKDLCDLCGDCVVTMRALQEGSHTVLLKLTEAYKYLLLAKETRALTIIGRCGTAAEAMSKQCGSLAARFGVMKADTSKDVTATIMAGDEHAAKVKELEKLRNDWEASKARQEAARKNLNTNIEELTTGIAKEEARVDEAEKRAFIGHIVGALAGAIGSGVGAVMNPAGRLMSQTRASMQGGSEGSGDPMPSPELEQKEQEKASAEKALKDAAAAEAQARSKKEAVEKQVFAAEADKESKRKLLENARAAKPVDQQKVAKAQVEFDTSSKTCSKLEADATEAKEGLKQALQSKSHAKDVLKGAAAALQDLVARIDKVADEQSAIAKEHNSKLLSMVDNKRKLEMLRLEAVEQLAELASRLESSSEEIGVERSAQTALEIATRALDNIYAALNNATLFWDSMTRFCKKLSESDLKTTINDELEFSTPEERVEVYKSLDFVRVAVSYLAQWAALSSVCAEYVEGSAKARRKVLENIKTSPGLKEARELLPIIQEKLKEELVLDAAEANENIANLNAQEGKLAANPDANTANLKIEFGEDADGTE